MHKERTPVSVQSEMYFQNDQLMYFLLSKGKVMEKNSYHSILQKQTVIEQYLILSTSYFIQIILTDERNPFQV